MKVSLRQKLLYSYLAVTLLLLIGVSVAISVLIRGYFIHSKEADLVNKGHQLGRVVESYNEGRINYEQFSRFINYVDDLLDARIWVVDNTKKIIVYSKNRPSINGLTPPPPPPGTRRNHGPEMMVRALSGELEPVFNGQIVTRSFYHPIFGEDVLMVAVPIIKSDGSLNGAIVLNSPVRGTEQFLHRLYYYIGGIGLAALFVTFLIVRYLAKGIIRPLRSMQQSAAAMARGDYNTRIEITSDDEVGELGKSLNTLTQELANFVSNTTKMEKLRRDFVANISHELRTPLTVIRGYTEALLDGTIPNPAQAEKYHSLMRDETIRLEGLINELLDLSRLQSDNNSLTMEKLPLAAIAEGVVLMLKQRAEQRGVNLEMGVISEDTNIIGNPDRLTQLILIFTDNALKFTPTDGNVTVSIERIDDKVKLTIKDTGVGISEEDLPFIWERFYKADKSHTRSGAGTGLGLAIGREIISRHGAVGEVESRLGEGTTFTITFGGVA